MKSASQQRRREPGYIVERTGAGWAVTVTDWHGRKTVLEAKSPGEANRIRAELEAKGIRGRADEPLVEGAPPLPWNRQPDNWPRGSDPVDVDEA